jgi:hypothetical protein
MQLSQARSIWRDFFAGKAGRSGFSDLIVQFGSKNYEAPYSGIAGSVISFLFLIFVN